MSAQAKRALSWAYSIAVLLLVTLATPAQSPSDRARTLIDQKHFIEAEALLRTAPPSADTAYLLAYTLLREDKPAESLAAYTRAAALRSPSADDLKNVAQDYALLNDYPDALRWAGRAVALGPASPEAWYSLGRIQYTQQLFGQAAQSFEHALTLAPRSVKAENNLGLAYEGQNLQEQAIAAYRQAIAWQAAEPPSRRSEQPLLNLAILLLHRQQLAEAGPLLREAAAIAPPDPHIQASIQQQLGQLYLQQADYAAARTALEAAVQLDPASSSLHFLLGQAYRRLGLTQQARQQFAAAARLAASGTPAP